MEEERAWHVDHRQAGTCANVSERARVVSIREGFILITPRDVLAVWTFLGISNPGCTYTYRWWARRRDAFDVAEEKMLALQRDLISNEVEDEQRKQLLRSQEVAVRQAVSASLSEMGIDYHPDNLDPADPRYRAPIQMSSPASAEVASVLDVAVGESSGFSIDELRRRRPIFKRPGQRLLRNKSCNVFDVVHLPTRTLIQVERHRKTFSGGWAGCVYFPEFEKVKSITMPATFKGPGPEWIVQFKFSEVPADQPEMALEYAEKWFVRAAYGQAKITEGAFALSDDRPRS